MAAVRDQEKSGSPQAEGPASPQAEDGVESGLTWEGRGGAPFACAQGKKPPLHDAQKRRAAALHN